jgi:hypothetical protein
MWISDKLAARRYVVASAHRRGSIERISLIAGILRSLAVPVNLAEFLALANFAGSDAARWPL